MKIARLASLMLVAILAIGLAAASAASAAPLFTQTGATITGTSGVGKLVAGTEVITCQKDTVSGTVTNSTLVGGLRVHFLECVAENSKKETCPAMSPGAPLENLIITNPLHGVLGLILPKPEKGSDIALLALPITQPFVSPLGKCIVQAAIEGSVAGLIEPVNVKSTTGKVTFAVSGGKQAITDVDLSTGGLVKPSLKAFGIIGATEETTENIEYSSATEVM